MGSLLFAAFLVVLMPAAAFWNVDPAVDCGLRKMALMFSETLLNGSAATAGFHDSVYNALNLNQCGIPRPARKPWAPRSSRVSHNDAGTEYYVSVQDGDDRNPGTKDKPFKTLSAAQRAVRSHPLPTRPAITVYVRGGLYYPAGWRLSPEDSGGGPQAPVTYQAYNYEKVVISGGTPLKLDWQSSRTIWQASIPDNISFNSLFIYKEQKMNNTRLIRARWPNGNPLIPGDGYSKTTGHYNGARATGQQFPVNVQVFSSVSTNRISSGSIRPLGIDQNITVPYPTEQRESWQSFRAYENGTIKRFNTTFNYPFWNTNVPMGMYFDGSLVDHKWANPETGIVHMFHTNSWGGWQFQIQDVSINGSNSVMHFSRGGFQEARGSGSIGGQAFYVDNIQEELDTSGEWFLDEKERMLYLWPDNDTDLMSEDTLVIGATSEFSVSLQGSIMQPVHDVVFRGLTFTHTATTFMESYEVPSGGDWSIHRGGTVFIEGAERISIEDCTFDQVGGNGVFLSNYVRNSSVTGCEFYACGDSAVAAVGSTDLMNGTSGTYPEYNLIERNHMHDVGVFGKQTSGYIKAITHADTIRQNVIYNGPRAGVNFNDGFAGGEILERNLIFNMVRETGDHGAFNSWDRQPFLYSPTDRESGVLGLSPETHLLWGNFIFNTNFIGSAHGLYCIDHDDGSSQYDDRGNVLVYGGIKYRDGVNRTAIENLVVYSIGAAFQVNGFQTDIFSNNTVILNGDAYTCVGHAFPGVTTANNIFYTPNDTSLAFHTDGCSVHEDTLEQWQQQCKCDKGSMVKSEITAQQILDMAASLLGM